MTNNTLTELEDFIGVLSACSDYNIIVLTKNFGHYSTFSFQNYDLIESLSKGKSDFFLLENIEINGLDQFLMGNSIKNTKGVTQNFAFITSKENIKDSEKHKNILLLITRMVRKLITNHENEELNLYESEEKFQKSFENASIGMSLISLKGDWLKVNKSVCNILGYKQEELLSKTFQDLTHPDDLYLDLNNIQSLIEGASENYQMEKRYFHKNGSLIWVCLSVSIIRNHKRKPLYFISQIQDITDRKISERDKDKAYSDLNSIMASLDDIIFEVDENFIFINVWTNDEKLLFMPKTKIIGKEIDFVLSGELATTLKKMVTEVIQTNKRQEIEYQSPFEDNNWFRAKITPIKNNNDLIKRVTLLIENITKKKQSDQNLKNTKEQLQMFIKASNDGFWDLNLKTKEIYYSPRWKEMFGYTEDELPNTIETWNNIIFPEDKNKTLEMMGDYNSGKIKEFLIEQRYKHKKGSTVYVLNRAINLKNEQGEIIRVIGAHTDITDRVNSLNDIIKSRDLAESASQAKSEFLALMSHEIRTPMNGVLGMTELLLQTDLTNEQRDFVKTLNISGESLLNIINDILDFSKIESGKMELEYVPFDISLCIRESFDLVYSKAQEKNLSLTYDISPEVPKFIKGDKLRLKQVLLNLINNAIKFTHQGNILLSLTSKNFEENKISLLFSIKDTGIGIPADKIDKLFQSFSQVDSSNNRKYGGTGLGLAICKKLVKLMNGNIKVESIENKGSVFSFEIVSEIENQFIENTPIKEDNNLAPKKHLVKILLAEDNLVNQMLIVKMLGKLGYLCDIANNGIEALEMMHKKKYDLIFMDIQMPEMDGLEATQKIIQDKTLVKPIIVALTANAMQGDKELYLSSGMDDYLSKPIKQKDLKFILEKYFNEQ